MATALKNRSGLKSEQRRPRDEGRATFQPTEATEIAAERLMRQSGTLTRTAAIRQLADLGARQATYDALRNDRVAQRRTAFAEMVGALSAATPADDASWAAAVTSLRGGAASPAGDRGR